MQLDANLYKLFGSKSRVNILYFLFNNANRKINVNSLIKEVPVNARLASTELKKLLEMQVLKTEKSTNNVFYSLNESCSYIEPLKKLFVQQDWLEWERPSRIHHLLITLQAGLKPMMDYYGHCLPYAHLMFNDDNVTWFFKYSEFQSLGEKLIPVYKSRKKEIWDEFNSRAENIGKHKDYKSFLNDYSKFWAVAYITEPISFYIDGMLKNNEQIVMDGRSFTDDYEDRIWDLAREAKSTGVESIDVKPILKDYFWIRNSYHDVHNLTEEEVRAEIRSRIGKHRAMPRSMKDPKSISPQLLSVAKDMIKMQDMRKMYMMKAAYYLYKYLRDIGKTYNLPLRMMVQTLPEEVLNIQKFMPELEEDLKKRQQLCTITGSLKDGIKVYTGKLLFPEGFQRKSKFEIRGNVACGGKAVGTVKIVIKPSDMYKVNHGDIIVSPMTTPDIVPAIRRCVAIVTNFGGITCHAAIISREFNIPCIVGTGNATELLSDGDLIEVDADKGIALMLRGKK